MQNILSIRSCHITVLPMRHCVSIFMPRIWYSRAQIDFIIVRTAPSCTSDQILRFEYLQSKFQWRSTLNLGQLSLCVWGGAFIIVVVIVAFSLHAQIHKKDNKCQSYMAAARSEPFPSICLWGVLGHNIKSYLNIYSGKTKSVPGPGWAEFLKA